MVEVGQATHLGIRLYGMYNVHSPSCISHHSRNYFVQISHFNSNGIFMEAVAPNWTDGLRITLKMIGSPRLLPSDSQTSKITTRTTLIHVCEQSAVCQIKRPELYNGKGNKSIMICISWYFFCSTMLYHVCVIWIVSFCFISIHTLSLLLPLSSITFHEIYRIYTILSVDQEWIHTIGSQPSSVGELVSASPSTW